MTKLQKIRDVITGEDERKMEKILSKMKMGYEWFIDNRDRHEKEFEEFRDKIREKGEQNKSGFYNYDGKMYCIKYPFVIETFLSGKFIFYGIETNQIYVDYADVSDMVNFLNTYRSKTLHYY